MRHPVDDIFGDSSEGSEGEAEEEVSSTFVATKDTKQSSVSDDFNIFDDSDDHDTDNEHKLTPKKVLGKKRKARQPKVKKASSSMVVDSDDDDLFPATSEGLSNQHSKKRLRKEKRSKKSSKHSKDIEEEGRKRKSSSKKGKDVEEGSGDEYDSGEDVPETQDDRDFIDHDDDHADIMDEYNDDQNFDDDERPKKAKSSKSSKQGSAASATPTDPANKPKTEKALLDQILGDYKGKKPRDLTDGDKDKIVENLKLKMEFAATNDEHDFIAKRPALHKFNMLSIVEQALAMKPLQEKLLDKNIMDDLIGWVKPYEDKCKTLPSLPVRTSVYKMILRLPVSSHHLTRSTRMPFGKVIMMLSKHGFETDENKRILKEIAEKWNRIIFGKSDEISSESLQSAVESNPKLAKALMQKYSSHANSSSTTVRVDLGKSSSGKVVSSDGFNRARVPINHGFLFTIQPAEKIMLSDGREEGPIAGEKRVQLRKIIGENKQRTSTGRKDNPRAMTVSVSGT